MTMGLMVLTAVMMVIDDGVYDHAVYDNNDDEDDDEDDDDYDMMMMVVDGHGADDE